MRWGYTLFSPEAVPIAAAKMVARIAKERIAVRSWRRRVCSMGGSSGDGLAIMMRSERGGVNLVGFYFKAALPWVFRAATSSGNWCWTHAD